MVKLIKTKKELIDIRASLNINACHAQVQPSVGFVPTMGNLHAGHLSLIKQAEVQSDVIFVSIFVNPTQFGPNEDFANYPRTLEEDLDKINSLKIEKPLYVFAPLEISDVYPANFQTEFSLPALDASLCGASRPGHFNGVLSVIYHLFNLINPSVAIFGQKDYQQYFIIKTFCQDFFPSISILSGPIVREKNGLALSSRNGYLSEIEKEEALYLSKTLNKLASSWVEDKGLEIKEFKKDKKNLVWDYLEILDAKNLLPVTQKTKSALFAGAMFVHNKVRVIDNLILDLK